VREINSEESECFVKGVQIDAGLAVVVRAAVDAV
jgi:hypothetical protein